MLSRTRLIRMIQLNTLTYASSDENYYLNLSLSVKISVYTYLQILMLLLFFKQWPELEQRGGV